MMSMLPEPGRKRSVVDGPLISATVQQRWRGPHATWFTLMGVGGGVFLLSRLLALEMRLGLWLGLPVVDLISFVAVAVGGLVLAKDLGRPLRLVRAVGRPRTSWISRGAIADFVFLLLAVLLVLPDLAVGGWRPFAGLPWDAAASGVAGRWIEGLALLSAAVVVYYAGQVLADSIAIPYWRSLAIPIQFVLSSLAVSMGIVMFLETVARQPIGALQFGMLLVFLAGLLVAVVWHLRTRTTVPGKAESLDALLCGRYRAAFLAGVIVGGTLVPMAAAVLGLLLPPIRPAAGVLSLICTLPAGFGLRLLTLRVGFYAPLRLPLRLRSV